jgi:hypothetical protein
MTSGDSNTIQNHAAFIWSVADLLRGDYKQSEYGKVILPLTVLRRLDCVLEPTKQAVLDRAAQLAGKVHNLDPILQKEAGEQFYNTSRFDFATLVAAPDDLADNLKHYIASFSARPATCSTSSSSPPRSTGSNARGCSTWSCPSLPRSICTPTRCPTWRWAICMRS